MKAPINPHDIARKDQQTISDYLKHVDDEEPTLSNLSIISFWSTQNKMIARLERKGIVKRYRRKIVEREIAVASFVIFHEGSYNNFSVDEKKHVGKRKISFSDTSGRENLLSYITRQAFPSRCIGKMS